jgi:UrcA family protein
MFNPSSRFAPLALAVGIGLTAAMIPMLSHAGEARSVAVQFAGLDLTSEDGRAILHRRVDRAVEAVCGTPDIRSPAAVQTFKTCARTAHASAKTQVEAAVAAANAERNVASSHTPAVR